MSGPSAGKASLKAKEQRFFYLVGRIVTGYQQIEDFFPTIFRHALPLDRVQCDEIFRCVRGLEAKIDIVSAALWSRSPALHEQWQMLFPKIAALAAERNKVGHATPAFVHARLIVTVSAEGDAMGAKEEGESHFRLEKSAKANPTTYRENDLKRIATSAFDLLSDLVVFAEALKHEKLLSTSRTE